LKEQELVKLLKMTTDIRIEQGKVRIYSEADRKHCEDIANETKVFFQSKGFPNCLKLVHSIRSQLTHFYSFLNLLLSFFQALKELRNVMDRVMGQVKSAKQTIENEQQLVVGIRNAIENECEDRNEKKGEMNNDIEEKKAELDALRKEYESLKSVLQSQESEINKLSIESR